MSKRVGAIPEETRNSLLAAARSEFAACGFQNASLRRICAAAGVTTGALYFFFEGKDDLFQAVLAQIMEPFERLLAQHYAQERAGSKRDSEEGRDADFEVSRLLIVLYFEYQQTWDILAGNRSHPAVRAFLDRVLEVSAAHYQALLQETPGVRSVDGFAIRQFAKMQTDAMLDLISQGFSQEDMVKHSKVVIRMLRGAFAAMLTE